MISPIAYLEFFRTENVNFFSGVPDSLLKEFCACVGEELYESQHIISVNEGGAIALAIGNHLATGDVPLVYIQNSGLGNCVNPLLSLASPEIYAIPMVLMIGWRGEPNEPDEPQHVHQGRVMLSMLESMDVPYVVLDQQADIAFEQTTKLLNKARTQNRPVAIVVRKNTFSKYSKAKIKDANVLNREEVIGFIADSLPNDACVICTTGMPSRELFEFRKSRAESHSSDFLTVGGMGHASHIALGIAAAKSRRAVYCIDGDGAALMHLGALAINGQARLENFHHIVLNNGAHGSVGGQPTVAKKIDLCGIAEACGYKLTGRVSNRETLRSAINSTINQSGPSFFDVRVGVDSRSNLGRPSTTPEENKLAFIENLRGCN